MVKATLFLLVTFISLGSCTEQAANVFSEPIVKLRFEDDYTPKYNEVIQYYQLLAEASDKAELIEAGETDSGKALHLFILSGDGDFDPVSNKEKGKTILLINNGIHPGEPAGIDASLKFADELVRNADNQQEMLKNTTICIVPVYNVGGHLNRSKYNRANQVEPEESGFRGNARNLDLNRDFIKCDSKNAQSFNKIFTAWNPDVFLDTHTTNGSDHQYSITLISTCPSALPLPMENFLRKKMLPNLYGSMAKTPYEMIPYVTWRNRDPEKGLQMTFETPRFSTGYSRLHHSYGFMTENHVYKPYKDRVLSVYHFMKVLANFTFQNADQIRLSRKEAIAQGMIEKQYHSNYEIDTTNHETMIFKGFKAGIFKSKLTGLERFSYDRTQPFAKEIRFFTIFNPVQSFDKPAYFLLPSAWIEAITLLQMNGVEMTRFTKDTTLKVKAKYITEVSHPERPYNGHYFHSEVSTETRDAEISFFEGDFIIPLQQEKYSYIMECLTPEAPDSYFRWNFFDEIFDTREYFSSWGFEANAEKYLNEHPEFKKQWLEEIKNNPRLQDNHYEQMKYLYTQSEWMEKSHMRYPVYQVDAIDVRDVSNE